MFHNWKRRNAGLREPGRATLLPVLVPAVPYETIISRIAEAAGEILRGLGVEEAKVAAEEDAMRDAVIATTNDRRVLGSMTDFANMLDATSEIAP